MSLHCLPPHVACRSELFSYTDCVSYAVLTSLVSLERVPLKKRVVDSPEIRSVIGHVPSLEACLNALYDCKYKEFFRVGGWKGLPCGFVGGCRWGFAEAGRVCLWVWGVWGRLVLSWGLVQRGVVSCSLHMS